MNNTNFQNSNNKIDLGALQDIKDIVQAPLPPTPPVSARDGGLNPTTGDISKFGNKK